jgi:putative membrane protein
MRPLVIACALGGITLLAMLVLTSSPAAIVAILTGSAAPLVAASLYRVVPLSLYAVSWRHLIAPASRVRTLTLLRLRWIGESVNALLPVAQVGGDVARARLLAQQGAPPGVAAASMVADLGMGAATQVVFTATGAVALSVHGSLGSLGRGIAIVCATLAAGTVALVVVARLGTQRVLRWLPMFQRGRNGGSNLLAQAANVDQALADIIARRADLSLAFAIHLVGWFAQAFETWMILHLIGAPISASGALVIESLSLAARSAVFIVPGGVGVQEGALMLLAAPFGIAAPVALSLGIIKRMRELVVGAPAIISWSIAERHLLDRLWRRVTRRGGPV